MDKKRFVSSAEMRRFEKNAGRKFGIRTLLLMENAGRSVAEVAVKLFHNKRDRLLVVCGPGNNGGDGFAAARHLYNKGRLVSLIFLGSRHRLKADALENFRIAKRMKIPLRIFAPSSTSSLRTNRDLNRFKRALDDSEGIVDALFGTGLKRPLKEPYLSAIRLMNASGKRILAIDTPSGLDADDGRIWREAVRADVTVALGYPKKGFQGRGKSRVGRWVIGDISLPRQSISA